MKRALTLGVACLALGLGQALAQTITVTKPALNDTWYRRASYTITWTHTGQVGYSVDITLLSAVDNAEVLTIAHNAVASSGSQQWTVPASLPEAGYKVRVKAWSVIGTSGQFSVKEFKVTAPNGGESWQANASKQITWTGQGVTGTVGIELWKGGASVGVVAPSVVGSLGTYTWKVGAYQGGTTHGSGFKVKVISTNPALDDTSDNPFTITEQGQQGGGLHAQPGLATSKAAPALAGGPAVAIPIFPVKISTPLEGDTWRLSDPHVIRWTSDTKPDDGFTVDLLGADGTKVRTMLDGAAKRNDDGSWEITDYISCGEHLGDYKIRITSWYARSTSSVQKPTTSGIVHAVDRTKRHIENIPVYVENATLTFTNVPPDVENDCEPVAQHKRARVGRFGFFNGVGPYNSFNWARARLTLDLSKWQKPNMKVESASLTFGDSRTCPYAETPLCWRRLFAVLPGEPATWDHFGPGAPGEFPPFPPLGGWSSGNIASGVADITEPVRAWINGTKPNLGFVVTGAEDRNGCDYHDCAGELPGTVKCCEYACVTYFAPIVYITFIEDQCQ